MKYIIIMRCVSPWDNRNGWLGVKHQITYLLTPISLPYHSDKNQSREIRHTATWSRKDSLFILIILYIIAIAHTEERKNFLYFFFI